MDKKWPFCLFLGLLLTLHGHEGKVGLELVSKELNHLAAVLHVYTWGLIFLK